MVTNSFSKGPNTKIGCLLLVAVGIVGWISDNAAADSWQPIETNIRSNEKPRKVLFIGNSYTYYNDLDVVLKKLAASGKLLDNTSDGTLNESRATWVDIPVIQKLGA